MKPISWLGIILFVVGVLVLAYEGIDFTRQKKQPMWVLSISLKKHMNRPPFLRYSAD